MDSIARRRAARATVHDDASERRWTPKQLNREVMQLAFPAIGEQLLWTLTQVDVMYYKRQMELYELKPDCPVGVDSYLCA